MLEGVDRGFPASDPMIDTEANTIRIESAEPIAEEEQEESVAERRHELAEGSAIRESESEEDDPMEIAAQDTQDTTTEEVPPDPSISMSEVKPETDLEAEKKIVSPVVALARDAESIPPPTRPGLEPAMDPNSMESLLEEEYAFRQPQRGDILSGVVISIGSDEMIVDVGVKREGVVPANDLSRLGKEALSEIKEGDTIPVYVLRPRDRDGNLLLSIFRARSEVDWTRAQEMMESGEIFEGTVAAANKGGLVIPFGKIRGFLPSSQVVGIPRRLTEEAKNDRLDEMVNQVLPLKVIEVDRRRRRLIFSHRAAWWKWKEMQRDKLLSELKEGDVRKGVVSSLRDFGAFVDLGGADGLIHVSEVSWHRVQHPNEVLKVGDEVEAYVLGVDRDRKRIALSLKRLHPEPWAVIEEKFPINGLVEGVVTRVVDFGAFVKLEEGVEGLIHRSELADIEPHQPSDLVKEGDLLLLRVIRIDTRRRRIGLSLRQVSEQEWADWAATFRSDEPAEETQPPEPTVEEEGREPAVISDEAPEAVFDAAGVEASDNEETVEDSASATGEDAYAAIVQETVVQQES